MHQALVRRFYKIGYSYPFFLLAPSGRETVEGSGSAAPPTDAFSHIAPD